MKQRNLYSLFELLTRVPDVRKPRGIRYPFATLMTIAIGAVLCGTRTYRELVDWGADLSQPHLRRIGARKNPVTRQYQAPEEGAIRKCMQRQNPEALDRLIGEWLFARAEDDDRTQ